MARILDSRTLIRACVVASVLLLALHWRLTMAVRTAYDSGWLAGRHCDECLLPNDGWIGLQAGAAFAPVALLALAIALFWRRRLSSLEAVLPPKKLLALEARVPMLVAFTVVALCLGGGASGLTTLADTGHRGLVTLATGLELTALAFLAATAIGVARATRPAPLEAVHYVAWGRWFLQRQRITLIVLFLFVFLLTMFGQTSGQAIDSIRVWTAFGSDRDLARLSFGLASALLLALVVYESGLELTRKSLASKKLKVVPRSSWVALALSAAALWGLLLLLSGDRPGWGLLLCAGILALLGLLEWGGAGGLAPPAPAGGGSGAAEHLAVVPLLALAIVALAAAVDSGLADGGARDAAFLFLLALVLAAFAVLMTRESEPVREPIPRRIWALGLALFLVTLGPLIAFDRWEVPLTSLVGFSLLALTLLYFLAAFRDFRVPLLGRIGRWRLAVPVALGTGVATFGLVHVDPQGLGATLGAFALLNLSLAFILTWLPWIVRWSLQRRPPTILWALGLRQLPIVSLVLLAWVLAGIVKPPATLHDVRLVDHTSGVPRPTLAQVFDTWLAAQTEVDDENASPIPLVLVAAHGGGIKAAYWTALVLDCVVGVSAEGFDAARAKEADEKTCEDHRRDTDAQRKAARRIFMISSVSGGAMGMYAYARELLARGKLEREWYDDRLAHDFVSPTVGWGLFHDVPNHILGLSPHSRGACSWSIGSACLTMDRGTVLETSFDEAFDDVDDEDRTLRATWEARGSTDPEISGRAKTVPLLVGNATVTGGKARAVISAADLAVWPSLERTPPPGADPRPLAGTVEVGDVLCMSNDLRLSTASLLAGHFPYVSPSARLGPHCGAKEKEIKAVDERSSCARTPDPDVCRLNLVDGGYSENSGLFTIVALWPALKQLVQEHNEQSGQRPIAPVIVEIDNHYRPRARDVPRGSGGTSETLIPPATAFGARSATETFARAAVHRITGPGCTLTISPRLHPGLVAPLGWELSTGARDDLRKGLVEPRPNTTEKARLTPVFDLRRIQAWLGGEDVPDLGTDLAACVPR